MLVSRERFELEHANGDALVTGELYLRHVTDLTALTCAAGNYCDTINRVARSK